MKSTSFLPPILLCILVLGVMVSLTSSCKQTQSASSIEAISIAKDAYTYGLPLVLMDISRRQQTNVPGTTGGSGAPMNQLNLKSGFPTADDTLVVAPNADTYYCTAWGDFSEGPLVFQMPDPNGRYYVMPFLDAFTNVDTSLSERTGFANGGTFFIKRAGDPTQAPDTMHTLTISTSFFWLLGRIQCNGTVDGDTAVIPLQNKMKLVPYQYWGQAYTPPANTPDPTIPKGSPNDIVENMPIDSFFNYLNRLLGKNQPLPTADAAALASFAKIGVGPGLTFNLKFDGHPSLRDSMTILPKAMFKTYRAIASKNTNAPQGWKTTVSGMGTYGADYLQRAVVSVMGLGANLPQDAVYPSSYVDIANNAYDGSKNNYKMTFKNKTMLPPAIGFWSLTMYNPEGYFVNNPNSQNPPIYAVGHNVSSPFKYEGSDSSLTILIQNAAPPDSMKSNWLPAPDGPFYLMMRLYYPNPNDPSVLDSSWTPPGVEINNE